MLERGSFQRPLNKLQLALENLEIKHLPRLGFLAVRSRRTPSLEFLPRHLVRFVHPGYTVEALSLRPSYFDRLPDLGPSHLSEVRWVWRGHCS
jgi:hypothetical protein